LKSLLIFIINLKSKMKKICNVLHHDSRDAKA
jgi:hypothetical protein